MERGRDIIEKRMEIDTLEGARSIMGKSEGDLMGNEREIQSREREKREE